MKKPQDEKFDGIVVQGEKFTQFVHASVLKDKDWVETYLMPILDRSDAEITRAEVEAAVKAALK